MVLNDFCVNASIANSFAHWIQLIIRTRAHGTLAFEVNEQGALLGLFGRMLAHANEGINHVIKRIEIIIEDNQIFYIGYLHRFQQINQFLFLCVHDYQLCKSKKKEREIRSNERSSRKFFLELDRVLILQNLA